MSAVGGDRQLGADIDDYVGGPISVAWEQPRLITMTTGVGSFYCGVVADVPPVWLERRPLRDFEHYPKTVVRTSGERRRVACASGNWRIELRRHWCRSVYVLY